MKKYLAIILSIAILAVAIPFGVFAGTGLTATDTWDGGKTAPSKQDAAGNYIIETAEEFAYVALSGGATSPTNGKSYKIADNSVFNMNGFEGITPDSTPENIKTATATGKYWYDAEICNNSKVDLDADGTRESFNIYAFAGTIDGNGAIIYNVNAKGAYSGLFPQAANVNVSISNITVKASQFNGYHMVGGIVGRAFGNGFDLTINGCAVENCYFKNVSTSGNQQSGTIVGMSEHMGININNCYVANNNFDTTNLKFYGGFVGNASAFGNALTFTNSVSIGTSPFPTVKAGSALTTDTRLGKNTCVWSNVYSDTATPDSAFDSAKSGISVLTLTNMTGANANANMNLDWSVWFANTAGAPVLRVFHDISVVDMQNGTHAEYCRDTHCDLTGAAVAHSPVLNNEKTQYVCTCGYSEDVIGNPVVPNNKSVVVWDGISFSKTTAFEDTGITCADTQAEQGTATNPYIIETPKQLRYVAQLMDTATIGKYFKIADGIAVFDFNNGNYNQMDNDRYFQGTFDGNGVEIINLNLTGYHAGLFTNTKNATLKNIKISGATSNGNGGNAGVLVAQNANTTTLDVINCAIINCTVNAKEEVGAIIGQAGSSTVSISNCFIANNTVNSATDGKTNNHILGNGWKNPRTISNSIVIGNDYQLRMTVDNVWSSDTAATGAGAVATMNLGDAWFDTASYPELSVFHDMVIKYIDADKHQNVCQVVVNGTPCTTCGPVVDHTFSVDDSKCTVCKTDCPHTTTDTRQDDVNGPTCGAAGSYTLVTFCTKCNKVTNREPNQVGEPATGNHNYDNTVENPTGLCTVCSTPCGHTDTKWVSNNDGTCTTADTGKTVCNICGVATYTGSNPNFSGTAHTFDKNAADGKCTVCSADCAHTNTDTRQEDVNGPTCGAAGSYTLVTFCTECNKVTNRAENQVGDAATGNHNYDKTAADGICTVCSTPCAHTNGTSTRQEDVNGPTCGAAGSYTLVTFCNDCNKVTKTEPNQVGDAATGNHNYDKTAADGICTVCSTPCAHPTTDTRRENIDGATCGAAGSYDLVTFCTECNKVTKIDEDQVGDAATGNHNYDKDAADGICTVCSTPCAHPTTDTRKDDIQGPSCVEAGSYTLITFCTVCNKETDRAENQVGEPATGHTFDDCEAHDASCTHKGNIAYKYCECGKLFAIDEDDKFSTDYLDFENDIATPIEPDKHEWVEVKAADATTEKEGNVAYKYCEYCALLVVGEKEYDLNEDKVYTDEFWKVIDEKLAELENQGLSMEEFDEIMNEFYNAEVQKAIVTIAKAEGVTLTIDKIVVEEPKPEDTKTENKTEDNKTETKPEVDNNKTSPDTSDNLVTVVLMATLIGAAFVIVRKARKA